MKCEKCGKELQEGWNSCPYCGASVGENGDDSPKSKKQPSDSKPPKKKHKVRNIAIVIVVLIIIFAVISGGGDGDDSNTSDKNTQEKEVDTNISSEEKDNEDDIVTNNADYEEWAASGYTGTKTMNIEFKTAENDPEGTLLYGYIVNDISNDEGILTLSGWEAIFGTYDTDLVTISDWFPEEILKWTSVSFNAVISYDGESEGIPVFAIEEFVGNTIGTAADHNIQLMKIDNQVNNMDSAENSENDIPDAAAQEAENTDLSAYMDNNNPELPLTIQLTFDQEEYYDESNFYPYNCIVTNNTNVDIKDVKFTFIGWDGNGIPIKVATFIDEGDEAYYEDFDFESIAAGTSLEDQIEVHTNNSFIDNYYCIVREYTDFEGNTWTNPAFDKIISEYAGKKFNPETMYSSKN